jgi:RES domain-containing protein
MQIFRIEKRTYLPNMLQGISGEKYAFRWNTKGHPVVYAAESRSLALVEKLVNLAVAPGRILPGYVIAVIDLPDADYPSILTESLPMGWGDIDAYHPRTQELGDAFLQQDVLLCYVPSVVVQGEYNVLLNPRAIDRRRVSVEYENIDPRLVEH